MKLHERGLAMSKILIVEDEESIADIEKDSRLKKGFYKAKKQIMNDEGAIWQ